MRWNYFMAFALMLTIGNLACSNPPDSNSSVNKGQEEVPEKPSEFENLLEQYESNERVIWQKPEMIIALIDDIENKTIVDLGAGSGYFAFRLVGRAGKVIAVDIDPRFVTFMDSVKYDQLTVSQLSKFETRLGTPTNPELKIAEADEVLVANTYIYIQERVAYFSNLKKNLKPKGRVIVVDYKPGELPIGPDASIKMSAYQVTQELEECGYEILNVDETSLQYQYIIIAQSKY